MRQETVTFQGSSGLDVALTHYVPEGTPQGVVLIVHGYAEHQGRYLPLVEVLLAAGFAVTTFDLRGHGKSQGARAQLQVFRDYVDDVCRAAERMRDRFPQKPRFILGHSVGALVALQTVLEHPEKMEGMILSAPFLQNAVAVSPAIERIAGVLSRTVPGLPVQSLPSGYLQRDPQGVAAYQNDPLVYHGRVKARMGYELLRTGPYLLAKASEIGLPVLLQHGSADKIAAPEGSALLFKRLGSKDKQLKLYEGLYHEIYLDDQEGKVVADLLAWLGPHAKAATH